MWPSRYYVDSMSSALPRVVSFVHTGLQCLAAVDAQSSKREWCLTLLQSGLASVSFYSYSHPLDHDCVFGLPI